MDNVAKVDKGVNCRMTLSRILPGIQIGTSLQNEGIVTETFHGRS